MKRYLAAGIVAIVASAPLWAQDQVAEPKTGVQFSTKADGKTLLGVGLRVKTFLVKWKVYAVGLYVADSALAGPLAAHKGKVGTPAFYKDLVWGDFDKHVTLKFVRNVGQDKIQSTMREALEGKTDKALLDRFVSYFPEIKEGQECTLRWAPGGTLEVVMAGQPREPIANKEFAAAVFGLYLGEQPLQEDIKKGLVSRAAELLKP